MKISIGNDHAGVDYKNYIIENLNDTYEIKNHGTNEESSVDYPDFAHPVSSDIENKKNSMENFIEPDNNPLPGSDEASVFMKKRLLQHKKYLKTARGAQQAMEKISEKEAALDNVRQGKPKN